MINYADINIEIKQWQRLFLGRTIGDISFAVVTPLYHAYRDLYLRSGCVKDYVDGFYYNADIVNHRERGILICLPQGVASQDVMYLFRSTPILFFGFAGGMNSSVKIGDIVTVNEAITDTSNLLRLSPLSNLPVVRGAYSPCFLGKPAALCQNAALEKQADVVDMELVSCAEACAENGNSLQALLIITDLPGKTEAWMCTEIEQRKIAEAFQKALGIIVKEVF